MNHTYFLPFLVSTVVHGAVLYSLAGSIDEPKVYLPQSLTALEICIQGSVSDIAPVPAEREVTEPTEKEEEAIEEKETAQPERPRKVVRTVVDAASVVEQPAVAAPEERKEEVVHTPLQKKEALTAVPPTQRGNSEVMHAGAVGSDNGFSEPELTYNPTPKYPRKARREEQEGMVVVMIAINDIGDVTAANVATSSGYPLLDNAAVTTVKKWRFVPAKKQGKAIASERVIPFVFKLK